MGVITVRTMFVPRRLTRAPVFVTVSILAFPLAVCSGRDSKTISIETGPSNRRTELDLVLETAGQPPQHAHLSCLGEVSGTGYLEGDAAGAACVTVNISGAVNSFLDSPKQAGYTRAEICPKVVKLVKDQPLPAPPFGKLTITGTFTDFRIRRVVDSASGEPCDVALWKLMAPLISPAKEPLIVHVPGDW